MTFKKEEELRSELLHQDQTTAEATPPISERDYSLCVSDAIRNQFQNKYTLELMKLIGQTETSDSIAGAGVV